VIPIIVREVNWYGAPFAKLSPLPTGGKPLDSWSDREAAFFDIVQGIRRVVETMTTPSSNTSSFPLSKAAQNITKSSGRNKRLEALEKILRESYSSIREYEDIIRLSDDPRRKVQAQKSI